MNFYQQQHQFYCDIDLHANSMYACLIDRDGKKLLHRNFKTRQPKGEGSFRFDSPQGKVNRVAR